MKKKITFSIIGVVGIILTIVCLLQDVGKEAEMQYFGGDAYTGMQHASAYAANNVLALTKLIKVGFSSLLFLLSILSLGYGFFSEPETKTIENKESEVTMNTMGID